MAAAGYEEKEAMIVLFPASNYSDPSVFSKHDESQVIVWPRDVVPTEVPPDRLPVVFSQLLKALELHQTDKVINLLTRVDVEEKGVEWYSEQLQSVNSALGAEIVTVEYDLLVVKFNTYSDQSLEIRKALLKCLEQIREMSSMEEEASLLESINSQSLAGEVMDDLEEHEDDKFQPSDDEFRRLCVKDYKEEIKQCYYPTQEYMADRIIERIRVILQHHHKKRLDDYDKFEFQIYTVNSNMLEEQTVKRLCQRQAECFPPSLFAKPKTVVLKEGKKRVNKYNLGSADVNKRHEELVRMSLAEPKTLFLVVADEAHWGITRDETSTKNQTANNKLVNSWQEDKHPNVIVLQVSATPFNLLTEGSRIPFDRLYALDKDNELKAHFLDPNIKSKRLITLQGEDVTNSADTPRRLHHVKWSECFEAKLQLGIVAKLKIALESGDGFAWTFVGVDEEPIKMKGAELSEMAHDLVLKGHTQSVNITTADGSLTLGVLEADDSDSLKKSKQLCFMKTNTGTDKFQTNFTLHCALGQDVFQLQCGESFIYYDTTKNQFLLGRAPPLDKSGGFEIPAKNYLFVIESSYSVDDTKPGKEYLSLNSYYNTMRNEGRDRLLRTDPFFTALWKKIEKETKASIDDILAAEYSYYILITKPAKKLQREIEECVECLDQDEELRELCDQYYENQQRRFERFKKLLQQNQQKGKHFKPILPKVFTELSEYLQAEAKSNFAKELRKRHRKNADRVSLSSALMECVVHGVSATELDDLTEHEDWAEWFEDDNVILETSETYRIVEDLFSSKTGDHGLHGLHGSLKILRLSQGSDEKAQQAKNGNRIYSTMCIARKLASENNEYLFEILRDYDNFKLRDQMKDEDDPDDSVALGRIRRILQPHNCQHFDQMTHESCQCVEYFPMLPRLRCGNCSHLHKEIVEYSDLDRLPCILILDRKGRMGDTFPLSFNVMDLRLNFVKAKSIVYLSSVMQDLGRMCRYADKSEADTLPYALIGPQLEKVFREKLKDSGVFYGIVSHPNCKVDRYVTDTKSKSKKQNQGNVVAGTSTEVPAEPVRKAAKGNFDRGNTTKHHNRLLLEAEPQVGKTGVFLNVISKLRKCIEGEEEIEEAVFEDDQSDDEKEEGPAMKEQYLDASDWEYPYWKFLQNSSSLPTKVNDGKYGRLYGPYVYGRKPQPLMKPVANQKQEQNRKVACESIGIAKYKAFSRKAHRCLQCSRDTACVTKTLTVAGHEVQISVPHSRRFLPVIEKLGIEAIGTCDSLSFSEDFEQRPHGPPNQRPKVKSWIFTPSYRREAEGNLNLTHTMVESNGRRVDYVQILVVRPEEFQVYCECWKSTHAILQLPNELCYTDEGIETNNVNEGGVGFARSFIQLFAREFRLDHIFMSDDNIPLLYEVVLEKRGGREVIVKDSNRDVKLKNVSMFKVLSHMESQIDHSKVTPKPKNSFETCREGCCCKRHGYTGPPEKYAILGMMKARPSVRKMVNPFKRIHVCSLVLVNIDALAEKSIRYKPWPVHEDIEINIDCDKKGLWVCKYNRFVMAKTHLKTWLPDVFEWSEEIVLTSDCETMAENWIDPLLQWLKCNAPPKRIQIIPEISDNAASAVNIEEAQELITRIRQIRCGRSLCIVASNQLQGHQSLKTLIENFYRETTGVGGYDKHVLLLSSELCLREELVSVRNFRERLIRPCFGDGHFKVLTSHNILHFSVPMILIYVKGKASNTVDGDTTGNIVQLSETFAHKVDATTPVKASGDETPARHARIEETATRTGRRWDPIKAPVGDPRTKRTGSSVVPAVGNSSIKGPVDSRPPAVVITSTERTGDPRAPAVGVTSTGKTEDGVTTKRRTGDSSTRRTGDPVAPTAGVTSTRKPGHSGAPTTVGVSSTGKTENDVTTTRRAGDSSTRRTGDPGAPTAVVTSTGRTGHSGAPTVGINTTGWTGNSGQLHRGTGLTPDESNHGERSAGSSQHADEYDIGDPELESPSILESEPFSMFRRPLSRYTAGDDDKLDPADCSVVVPDSADSDSETPASNVDPDVTEINDMEPLISTSTSYDAVPYLKQGTKKRKLAGAEQNERYQESVLSSATPSTSAVSIVGGTEDPTEQKTVSATRRWSQLPSMASQARKRGSNAITNFFTPNQPAKKSKGSEGSDADDEHDDVLVASSRTSSPAPASSPTPGHRAVDLSDRSLASSTSLSTVTNTESVQGVTLEDHRAQIKKLWAPSYHSKLHHKSICQDTCTDLSPAEQSRLNAETSNKTKFKHEWLIDPNLSFCKSTGMWWLIYVERQGMFCFLCRKHNPANPRNKRKIFNTSPATCFRPDTLKKHVKDGDTDRVSHGNAVKDEHLQRTSAASFLRHFVTDGPP